MFECFNVFRITHLFPPCQYRTITNAGLLYHTPKIWTTASFFEVDIIDLFMHWLYKISLPSSEYYELMTLLRVQRDEFALLMSDQGYHSFLRPIHVRRKKSDNIKLMMTRFCGLCLTLSV